METDHTQKQLLYWGNAAIEINMSAMKACKRNSWVNPESKEYFLEMMMEVITSGYNQGGLLLAPRKCRSRAT